MPAVEPLLPTSMVAEDPGHQSCYTRGINRTPHLVQNLWRGDIKEVNPQLICCTTRYQGEPRLIHTGRTRRCQENPQSTLTDRVKRYQGNNLRRIFTDYTNETTPGRPTPSSTPVSSATVSRMHPPSARPYIPRLDSIT